MEMKPQHCLILLHLAWFNMTNSVLCILLESIDLMFLKLTRWAQEAIGSSDDYSGTAYWIAM